MLPPLADADRSATHQLAHELAGAGDNAASAIEYRRLALSAHTEEDRGGYYWAAAYQYRLGGEPALAGRMLDRAEDSARTLAVPVLLLRAETALDTGKPEEAEFYITTLFETETGKPAGMDALLARRLARARLLAGNRDGAEEALRASPTPAGDELAALARHRKGRGRVPWVGGVLGTIPGLGYAYSGEFANAGRSLLLNGLFIYGMVHTAQREQWGAFAAISFFELTWYSGSIYGGVDAAHRYNRDRVTECADAIDGHAHFSADLTQIPLVTLSFEF